MKIQCKRCLLNEAGEHASYETIRSYLDNLDSRLKVDDVTYQQRLALCSTCDELISGMCLKCGCYVEVRAALKKEKCADFNGAKWQAVD